MKFNDFNDLQEKKKGDIGVFRRFLEKLAIYICIMQMTCNNKGFIVPLCTINER